MIQSFLKDVIGFIARFRSFDEDPTMLMEEYGEMLDKWSEFIRSDHSDAEIVAVALHVAMQACGLGQVAKVASKPNATIDARSIFSERADELENDISSFLNA